MKIRTTIEKESTWAELKALSEAGKLSDVLKSGDNIPVTLKNGEEVSFDVGKDVHHVALGEHPIHTAACAAKHRDVKASRMGGHAHRVLDVVAAVSMAGNGKTGGLVGAVVRGNRYAEGLAGAWNGRCSNGKCRRDDPAQDLER